MTTFEDFGLKDEILKAIKELGFEHPMPIQEKTIPYIANCEKDLVALAQTGTGKTAGFGLPVLQQIDTELKQTQVLILAPTRELCIQISNDLKNFSKYMQNLKIVPVYGGEDIVKQLRQLDVTPQVIVATPGRLIDLCKRKKVSLTDIRFLVLDEADEMLNMGFQEDIQTIIEKTPENRRTFLFSATMPKGIANIVSKYMNEYEEIAVGKKNAGAENVQHIFYMVQAKNRYLALKRIVDLNPDIYGIVFCRTRQETKEVAEHLMRDGYNADALHGDLSQPQRDSVMQKFRIKNLQLLVATDVAARGLDVNDLTHVINYNLPDDVEVYTHRSGRTGRANKSGVSISIIHTKQRHKIIEIEKIINKKFEQEQIPNGLEVCKKQLMHFITRMENVTVNEEDINPFMPEILSRLNNMTREELIKRFTSIEFNRFLEYYKDAIDLNIETKSEKPEQRKRRGRHECIRFKINKGTRDGFTPKRLLGLINDTTNDKSINVGDIEITPKLSFFDIDIEQAEQIMAAFAQQKRFTLKPVSEENPRKNSQREFNRNEGKEKRNRGDKNFKDKKGKSGNKFKEERRRQRDARKSKKKK